jgi:hypothetical protein
LPSVPATGRVAGMTRTKIHRPDIQDIKGDSAWSALEADLLAACKLGRMAVLPGKEDRPGDISDPDRRVRAGLIRYLLLGGCDGEDGARPHPRGVLIKGGWIDGVLDFAGCRSDVDLGLQDCLLPQRPDLTDAHLHALYLPGCHLPMGAGLHRLTTDADVHLSAGFRADAMVDLAGARIGGQLACVGGEFLAESGYALNCQAARIGADVFLSGGFRATAEVNFRGAEIGGQLSCAGDIFLADSGRALNCQAARIGADVFLRDGFRAEGLVDFGRAEVTGNLQIQRARLTVGFDGEAMRVGQGFFWQEVTGKRRGVDLTEARVGSLRDDWKSWEGVVRLTLDGFQYTDIDLTMPVQNRLKWLKNGLTNATIPVLGIPSTNKREISNFSSYLFLADLFQSQGLRDSAASVLVERNRMQNLYDHNLSREMLDGSLAAGSNSIKQDFRNPLDWLFFVTFGYGHKPMRALVWVLGFVVFAAFLYGAAYDAGQMAPNSDVVLTSADWLAAVAAYEAGAGPLPQIAWISLDSTRDYESFNRWIYGLDLFVPLDALGQENAWAPSPARGNWGVFGFYLRPIIQAAGWIMTALGAAVLTGLVGRRD